MCFENDAASREKSTSMHEPGLPRKYIGICVRAHPSVKFCGWREAGRAATGDHNGASRQPIQDPALVAPTVCRISVSKRKPLYAVEIAIAAIKVPDRQHHKNLQVRYSR